jgi:hypothetical protein
VTRANARFFCGGHGPDARSGRARSADVDGTMHNGTVTDTMLSLFAEDEDEASAHVAREPAVPPHVKRIVADATDRVGWLRARSRGITATDVAKLSTPASVRAAAYHKLHGPGFTGIAYTEHGKAREPEIAAWVQNEYGILPSTALFRAATDARHLATPDGVAMRTGGTLELAEIKTTNKGWRSIPRHYLRQVWWQQYVLGAERTLFVWEQHTDFVPNGEPECRWVDRDENEIAMLVSLADQLLSLMANGRA